jgi:Lon protease-like protein
MTTEPDLTNPDTLEAIFHAALKAGDARGVEAALTVMAPIDPRRAERLLEATRAGVALATGQPVTWRLTAEVD